MTPEISQAEAHALLVQWMRTKDHGMASDYGYDLYLPNLMNKHLQSPPQGVLDLYRRQNTPAFAAAAWDLCRKGLLRPGVHTFGGQGTDDGYGYSVTPMGEAWLAESAKDPFVATEPTQLANMLAEHRARFGEGFHERAQEAVKDYRSNAFLSCCAMCGAAAESILLAVAIEKKGRDAALKEYRAGSGRGRIQTAVFGQATEGIRAEAEPGLALLKYWRDDASHGGPSGVTEASAFMAILVLVRFAALVNGWWNVLSSTGAPARQSEE